ncbi:MAG: hypothetical protein R3D71_03385 [Rickettsiales bacterium]
MTDNKKPLILVIDDWADAKKVTANIAGLADKLGFNASEIASQIKVITNADEALAFIKQAKQDNQPIAAAFTDNKMQGVDRGVEIAKSLKTNNPDTQVVWISSNRPNIPEAIKLVSEGKFSANDDLMFSKSDSSGVFKSAILVKNEHDDPLVEVMEYNKQIREILVPVFRQAFEQITRRSPSVNTGTITNSGQAEIKYSAVHK